MTNNIVTTLRAYQKRIISSVSNKNSVVLLPAGAGKTLIAAELVKQILEKKNKEKANKVKLESVNLNGVELTLREIKANLILVLVPSFMLVEQQAESFREWLGPNMSIGEYMVGLPFPVNFDVLVSTPKSFLAVQGKDKKLIWGNFDLVIFNEVHHVLKNHPYQKIALSIFAKNNSCSKYGHPTPQILGLSASLTHSVNERRVSDSLKRLVRELHISCMESATSEELQRDGYYGCAATTQEIESQILNEGFICNVFPLRSMCKLDTVNCNCLATMCLQKGLNEELLQTA